MTTPIVLDIISLIGLRPYGKEVSAMLGRKLALAPFLLSNSYHRCTEIIMGRFLYDRGPFWILQFWLQFYFPTASQFTPFSSKKFGPVWVKKSLDPNFKKLNNPELQDIWAIYLIAQDLPYSTLLDESSKCKYVVDHYSPNLFARQFGMTLVVPFHQ
ncbi:hypothetical protein RDI58_022186 [Solanum bulbocastanum]|uniref:Aminotransferase-like plant mobile domain-containing protein n=1 Tax=Solanum bulbocastanum TaxID=147425 RepID=A0AAN8T7J5_SOLBU